ncbi:MAG TPA: 2-dehydropantoate 2-reductase [Anaerolineae bacterium]|nr:2-dehydropantoate 2-reductase [Anaerolineae bacterium]
MRQKKRLLWRDWRLEIRDRAISNLQSPNFQSPMNLTIIGIGALGSLFAARLYDVAPVTMLGHWPEQITAVSQHGLTLIQPDGRRRTYPLPITNNPADVPPADLALILVKSCQTEQAAHLAQTVLKPDGLALTLQNGLGNGEKLAAVLGQERVIQSVTSEGAAMVAPGLVRHAGHGQTHLAEQPGGAPIVTLLRQAGFQVESNRNVASLLWGKLVVNTAINPLTAVLNVLNGYLAENEAARDIMVAAARETARVAAALGIRLPYPDAAQQALSVAQATAVNHSSMLQDIRRGAPTEIEAICGEVIRYGRLHAIPTPVNKALYHLVRALENKKEHSP